MTKDKTKKDKIKMNKAKKPKNFIDILTEKRLKRIMLLSGVLSLVFELSLDVLNAFHVTESNVIMDFWQAHKDFLTNIALGCLGSAFISYAMLHKSNKLINEERQRKLSNFIKSIAYKYNEICNLLNYILKDKDGKNYLIECEEILKSRSRNLLALIQDFREYSMEFNMDGSLLDGVVELCDGKMIPMIEEILDFLSILEGDRKVGNIKFDEDIFQKINIDMYQFLYENIAEDIKGINERLRAIVPGEVIASLSVGEIPDTIAQDYKVGHKGEYRMKYNAKLFMVNQNASGEMMKRKIEEIKEGIVKRANDDLDSFGYGEKTVDENQVVYIVNGEKMSVDQYREYCIKEELKKRGLS